MKKREKDFLRLIQATGRSCYLSKDDIVILGEPFVALGKDLLWRVYIEATGMGGDYLRLTPAGEFVLNVEDIRDET